MPMADVTPKIKQTAIAREQCYLLNNVSSILIM